MEVTIMLYRSPNVTLQDIFEGAERRTEGDALTAFSTACRHELANLKRGFEQSPSVFRPARPLPR